MALKYLRDNLKSLTWVLWGVVAVFVMLIFFQWGGVNDRGRGGARDIAATVGDQEITYEQFRQRYRGLEDQYRQTFGEQFNREMAKQFNLPVQALDQLINRRILLMEAKSVGLRATDGEVRQAILDYPAFRDESGRFIGTESYKRLLRANRQSVDQFETTIREDVLLAKLNTVLAQTAYVSAADVEKKYREQAELAKIRFVQLPATQMTSEAATNGEIEAYFADHQTEYELSEERVADYLMVDTVKLRREIEIPEEQIVAYHEANLDQYSREEQVRARHILLRITPDRPVEQAESELLEIRRRIEAGEDFAALAREFSDDESNSDRGGNLGLFGRNQMVKAFEDAAFGAAVGELVGPVQTDFGFHLIEVQDHREGGLQPLDQVRGAVRARLVSERVAEIGEAKIQDLASRIETEKLTSSEQLSVLAEEEGLTLQTTEAFGRNDSITGVGRALDFTAAAFDLEVGETSEPVKLPRGWAILMLKEIKPPRLPDLAEVESEVRQAVERENLKTAALRRLGELSSAVAAGGNFEELVSELGLEIQESGEFGRYGTIAGLGSNRQLIDEALELDAGQWGRPVESSLGAVLFEVIERQTFDAVEFEQEKSATRASQESERLSQLLSSLIELRRRDLTPKYDAQVLANFGIEQPPA